MTAAGDDRSSGLRRSIARASEPALIRLSRLPRAVPFLVMLIVIAVGLFTGGIAAFALLLVALLFLAWLLYLGWPAFAMSERLMRLSLIVLVTAVAVTKLFPR